MLTAVVLRILTSGPEPLGRSADQAGERYAKSIHCQGAGEANSSAGGRGAGGSTDPY